MTTRSLAWMELGNLAAFLALPTTTPAQAAEARARVLAVIEAERREQAEQAAAFAVNRDLTPALWVRR